jgi:ABC-type spermidine/putrescine transport system permease subunit II
VKRSPGSRKLLLAVHIVSTVGALGVDLVLLALGVAGLRGAEPRTIYPAAQLVGQWLLVPLALTGLTTGVGLALLTRWSPLRHGWVATKLAITTVLAATVLAVLVPRLSRVADAAVGAAPHLLTDAERVPLVAAPAAAVGLLALNVALGVYKPRRGGR